MIKYKKNKFLFFILILFPITIFFLFACHNQKVEKLHSYLASIKQKINKAKVKSVPITAAPPIPSVYKPGNLRAPFESNEITPIIKKDELANPLLIYPLNMLKFVGTLFEDNKHYAYIVSPDKKVFQIKVGDAIGDRHGKVLQIYHDHVEVIENIENTKPIAQHKVTLRLRND